ncbi:hypothetical protein E3U23_08710 [Erythrobacter litoralis]|uniref:helix-turn-helix transcriptional regulator n=1 Tax=Erythrobacter litoralis TaxID=39960 RepID=UPI002434E3F4|nr:LuxR C-terminal-related transcriptional regulator [Erythrobacter litoralis]MDG6079273.1 hypothetical protein [Erythrobacter litoralis]
MSVQKALRSPPDREHTNDRIDLHAIACTLDALDIPALIVSPERERENVSEKLATFLSENDLQLEGDGLSVLNCNTRQAIDLQHLAATLQQSPTVVPISQSAEVEMRVLEGLGDTAIPEAVIAVFRQTSDNLLESKLVEEFGLTEAECDVALAIYKGENRKKVAKRRGVSKETIKSQIKSVYEKVGCNREVDLIRCLSSYGSASDHTLSY